ncbi:MAG TPA: hypothetical protein VKB33_07960 [Nitrospira sp.]|nr:hypothetical protein [Nitrospira sp.]
MKVSNVWKRSSAKKKHKPTYKIRWELLGLSHPDSIEKTTSMDTVRSEVSFLATQGLSVRTHAPSDEARAKGRGQNRNLSGDRVKRRGASE